MSVSTTDQADTAAHGLVEHSHVGGRTVKPVVESHLHPVGSADPADHPVPGGREEVWRFTPLRRLRGLHDEVALTGSGFTVEVTGPEGISAASVSGDQAAALKGSSGFVPADRPSARAYAAADSVFVVDIPTEFTSAEPVTITFTGTGGGDAIAAHLLIRAGAFAQAAVVVNYVGSALLAENVEIIAGDSSKLTVVGLGEWAEDSVHLSTSHISIGRDATVKHAALAFGGDLVRTVVSVDYTAPGGDVQLLGLSFADAGQHLEQRLSVDHSERNCKSDVLYKGALQGAGAHTVWIGDVLIRATAEGTDTYEMNRNLLLTEGARADSVPNLEIETGEIVGAGHASATGRFDDEHMFYLNSRGIPDDLARRLVVRGFFGEVLQRIGVPSAVARAEEIIESELAILGN